KGVVAFVPLGLVTLATVIFLVKLLIPQQVTLPLAPVAPPPRTPQFVTALEPIIGRNFSNQVVIVDGKDFADCTFTNVTFRFRGGYYSFSGNTVIQGDIGFDTDNEIAQRAVNFFVWLDSHSQDHALSKNWKRLPPEHFK